MEQRPLGRTGLTIAPLVLGGNVFGWTADERQSHALLDAFVDAGFNAVDTADIYSKWVPGHTGGESESILGRWFAARPGRRNQVVLITKVGSEFAPDRRGLSKRWIMTAVEDSLRRLQTDVIDVYLSHWHDPQTPYEETLAAYDALLKAGKVRAVGGSNHSAEQLTTVLETARTHGLPRYEVLQPEYNLYERSGFEGPLRDVAVREGLGVIVYYSLAAGFLSGKYRGEADASKSPRGSGVMGRYWNDRGRRILAVLDDVAASLNAQPAEIALAWLMAKPGVTAPIASATTLPQMASLIRSTQLVLSPEHLAALDAAGS